MAASPSARVPISTSPVPTSPGVSPRDTTAAESTVPWQPNRPARSSRPTAGLRFVTYSSLDTTCLSLVGAGLALRQGVWGSASVLASETEPDDRREERLRLGRRAFG